MVVESNRIPQEMALSPLVGLLQSLKILMAVSLAHGKFSMSGLKCGDYGGELTKNPKQNLFGDYFLFARGGGC